MNDELFNLHYYPICNYEYSHWFETVQYNGKTLTDAERKVFVKEVDEMVARFSEGLSIMADALNRDHELSDDFHRIEKVLSSVGLFVSMTMMDSMIVGKYFILADQDYDRRFLRGKLRVILNEGFKKLYGFGGKTYKSSEWDKLLSILDHFPEDIHRQYQKLTALLQTQSKSSTWWKDDRDQETHLDAEQLFHSRNKDVCESEVMIDSMKLYSILLAVNLFLSNMHACLYNYLLNKYRRDELKE